MQPLELDFQNFELNKSSFFINHPVCGIQLQQQDVD
jgi:hypothetical protein